MKRLLLLVCVTLILSGCSTIELVQPVLKERMEPVYPYEAKIKGVEGKVEIFLLVNETGDVENVRMSKSSGSQILDNASVEYGKRLKFEPASLRGKPMSTYVKWVINYQLEDVKTENGKINILAFSKTAGVRHESIEEGKAALKKLADENNFEITFSEDAVVFNDNSLSYYDVVVFLNTSGDILNEQQEKAFQKFIRLHGGFVGIHGAIDTEHDWKWYGELLGTYQKDSPEIQNSIVRVMEVNHPSTKPLPNKWARTDQWINYTNKLPDDVKVLAVVEGNPVTGGTMGEFHPFCWYHEFDGGRAWYTAGGHTPETFSDEMFLKHLLGGIKYAAGVE